MCKGNKTIFFEDVEDRAPVLAGRFYADFRAVVFGKPFRSDSSQFPLGKRRKVGLFIFGVFVGVGNINAGIDLCFVDIKPQIGFMKDFKQ